MIKRLLAHKYLLFALLVPAWAFLMYFIIKSNPTDLDKKIALMRIDIAHILEARGLQLSEREMPNTWALDNTLRFLIPLLGPRAPLGPRPTPPLNPIR